MPDLRGLLTWAARPGAARVLTAARSKLEHGRTGNAVAIPMELDAAERDDVAVLLGAVWARSGRAVTLGALRRATRTHANADLEDLIVAVGGPLRDIAAERTAAAAAVSATRQAAVAALTAAGVAADIADDVVPRAVPLATTAAVADIWRALPAAGTRTGLATLSAFVTGDPHALDRNMPLGRTMIRLLDRVHPAVAQGAGPTTRWRALWGRVGVDCDAVSATVLVLGVHLDGDGPAAAQSRAAPGEPLWLTARALATEGWAWPDNSHVYVCENPSVVEAAASRFTNRCPPLVCTYGQMSTAAALLLAPLAEGHRVTLSTDRDHGGAVIAAAVRRLVDHAADWAGDALGQYEEERIEALLQALDPD